MNLQVTVHDWKTPGTIVWTKAQGHLCPALEIPKPGETVITVVQPLQTLVVFTGGNGR